MLATYDAHFLYHFILCCVSPVTFINKSIQFVFITTQVFSFVTVNTMICSAQNKSDFLLFCCLFLVDRFFGQTNIFASKFECEHVNCHEITTNAELNCACTKIVPESKKLPQSRILEEPTAKGFILKEQYEQYYFCVACGKSLTLHL